MRRIESPDLASPRFKANPFPFYARLRTEAPVHPTRLPFWGRAWLLTRYDDVRLVLKDERLAKDISSKMRWVPRALQPLNRNLLNMDPPDHTRLRALVSKAFTPGRVELLRDRVQQVCGELLDGAARNGRLELVSGFALLLPLRIIADLLGIPEPDRRRFYAWTTRVSAATSGATLDLLRAQPSLWLSMRYLRGLVALRRSQPRDDLITALLQAEEAGDTLSEDEVIGMIALLLLAGYETTLSLIALGTLALLQHPAQRQLLLEKPALAEQAIEEILRFTSPADIASMRIAREAVTIGPVTMAHGDIVLASIASANHDESQFPHPDALDITREPNRHVAFGLGAHFCLGAPLARLEGRIALTTLFRRFPNLRLAVPPEAVRWRRSLLFRSVESLPLLLS
jgi:cytochrome P450 PksS